MDYAIGQFELRRRGLRVYKGGLLHVWETDGWVAILEVAACVKDETIN